jgi:hypothetical protein
MKYSFSACWSDKLALAIKTQCLEPYPMALCTHDADSVRDAVNQGIDSHLESCFIPTRGDSYKWAGLRFKCLVSPESLPVLTRRLMESQNDNSRNLASSICETLEIELI